MKYVSFYRPDSKEISLGRLDSENVVELVSSEGKGVDLKTALSMDVLNTLVDGEPYKLEEIQLLPVVPNPGKILCVGLNYDSHRKEAGREEKEHPAIFTRYADTLIAHGDPIIRPRVSTKLDYEGELALVIGKPGRNIPEEDALDYVTGYACFNDASIRDWQKHNIQFTPGKNFPGTGAFGPYLITPDEVGNLEEQRVITRLNDEVLQDQPISDMIWPVATLINYISTFTRLSPGDVIVTGTPGGVGFKRTPPIWMGPGDVVEVSVGTVGTLVNPIQDEEVA
jgi:2-keto-4-pentenoate hydratase/2-oxohepta-3-ene-1,7-dioic acid hydratase in catechol pathway